MSFLAHHDYYHDYHYDYLSERQARKEFFEEKMKEQRKEVVKSISLLVRQDLSEDFAKILCAASECNLPEAENISSMLGLNQLDFLAINENLDEYINYFLENQDWSE